MAKEKKAKRERKQPAAEKKQIAKLEKQAMREKQIAKLEPIAKEINTRFEKAAKLEQGADDHRLAAAIKLAEAENLCKEAGVKFDDWAAENVQLSRESWRKLLPVGRADDSKKALADMREKNAEANKKHREKKKRTTTAFSEPADPGQQKESRVATAAERDRQNVLAVPTTERVLADLEASNGTVNMSEVAKKAFSKMQASAKMKFVEWAAGEIGVKVTDPFDEEKPANPAPADLEIPASLRHASASAAA